MEILLELAFALIFGLSAQGPTRVVAPGDSDTTPIIVELQLGDDSDTTPIIVE